MTGLNRILEVLRQPLFQLEFGGLGAIETLCV